MSSPAEPLAPTYWIILVGINYYRSGKGRGHPLQGPIHDIEDVEKMLLSYLEGKRYDITKITGIAPDKDGQETAEASSPVPTYETVVEGAFSRVQAQAKPGDFFFFHFSGHGVRQLRRQARDDKAAGSLWFEMLVLDGEKNLPDFELGRLLDGLAARDVATFAVLDCCHSGGADRGDDDDDDVGVRGLDDILEPDPNVDADMAASLNQDQDRPLDHDKPMADEEEGTRDVSTTNSFWLRAKNYTLLAACHPSEKAKEIPDQGRWRGVLTSGILRAVGHLSAAGGVPTYRALYEIIRTWMMKEGYTQRCMLHGRRDRFLFGRHSLEATRVGTVRDVGKHALQIDIGEVHGVCLKEEYDVYPRGGTIGSASSGDSLARVKISRVEATQSIAQLPQGNKSIEVGCVAKLVHPVIRQPLHVKVQDEMLLTPLLDVLCEEPSPFNPTLHSGSDGSDSTFQVLLKGSNYELADATGTSLRHSPPVPADSRGEAAKTICTRLRRLAQYRFVAELVNKRSRLKDMFTFCVSPVDVLDGEPVTIEYKNLTKGLKGQDLYFTLLNLTSRGAVKIHGASTCVGPEDVFPDEIRMTIPGDVDSDQIEDILMVIVTTEESQFDALQTPGLHVLDEGSRGDDDVEDLADVVNSLEDTSRDTERIVLSSWQTQQVIIRTRRRLEQKGKTG